MKIYNSVNPEFRVNLPRVQFFSDNPVFNQKVLERLARSLLLKGRPRRIISTPGSDTYYVRGSRGIRYEVVLGKAERRGYCTCPDFQRNLRIAEEKGYDSVLPCKHILKILAYRRATRK